MNQKTKLKIIGPYKSDYPGPFCTREGVPVEVKMRDGRGEYPVLGYIGDSKKFVLWTVRGEFIANCLELSRLDLMCAEEVPQPREFWINEFRRGDGKIGYSHNHYTPLDADNERSELKGWNWTRTIHVREVPPGEGK